jgi:hypothetical protein
MSDTPDTPNRPKTVPAFYESSAPHIIPQLLSHTDILLHDHSIPTLLAHEELSVHRSSGVVRSRTTRFARFQPPYARSVTFLRSSRSPTPSNRIQAPTKKRTISKSRSQSPLEDLNQSDLEGSEFSYDSDDSAHSQQSTSDNFKIPKPTGEVGRPGSGGYNLRVELELHPRSFTALKVFRVSSCRLNRLLPTSTCQQDAVNKLIETHLNDAVCYSKQDSQCLRKVCDEVSDILIF